MNVSHILHKSRVDFFHIPQDTLNETNTTKYNLDQGINENAVFVHRRIS
jgi:hypothetical protein